LIGLVEGCERSQLVDCRPCRLGDYGASLSTGNMD